MTPKIRTNPDDLLEFFSQLDPGGSEGGKCELHYGCDCVIRRGTEAAKALVAIRELLGISALDAANATAPAAAAADQSDLKADLSEARTEMDRLLLQNMQFHKENKTLREKIQQLQKQVERLYTKNEMSATLKKIEGKKLTEAERALEQSSGDQNSVSESGPETGGPDAHKNLNKELADELHVEAAIRVSKEQIEKEKAEREQAGAGN